MIIKKIEAFIRGDYILRSLTKNARMCFLGLLFLAMLAPGNAEVLEEAAKITAMIGTVEVRSGESAVWRKAKIGMPVKMKWEIRTYLESSADITLESGTVLRMAENSVVLISKMLKNTAVKATRSELKVTIGQVWANVKKLSSTSSEFQFETPTAVAAIRGTRLGINVTRGNTRIDVYEGIVLIRRKDNSRTVPVTTENRAEINAQSEEIEVKGFKEIQNSNTRVSDQPVDPFVLQPAGVPAGGDSIAVQSDTAGSETKGTNETGLDASIKILMPAPGSIVTETPVTIRGLTAPGATVVIYEKVIDAGKDGTFAAMVDLQEGSNSVPVLAYIGGKTIVADFAIEYHPPLLLNVINLSDRMEVSEKTIELILELSPNAQFSVNGKQNEKRIELLEGANTIIVEAWDKWQNRTTRQYVVLYRQPSSGARLLVSTPAKGAVIREPLIFIAGSATPGARIYVNDLEIASGPTGEFSTRLPIPDEPQTYAIEVRAIIGDRELSENREVIYERAQKPLSLDIVSPAQGQTVSQKILRINGKTDPRASVTVNGRPALITGNGVFSAEMIFTERNIGNQNIEIIASRENEEVSGNIGITVNGASPQINTSVPTCIMQSAIQQATTRDFLLAQVTDRTVEDQLTLEIVNNGSTERFTLESGATEKLTLTEGKNKFSIRAIDRAGNVSQTIQGQVYYLPGPLAMRVNEPDANPYIISGLPPLPRGYGAPRRSIEIEIDDGIGNVPETIRFCRITGNGQSVLLSTSGNYVYRGNVLLARGDNTFIIQAEDLAGNSSTNRLSIILK